MTREWKPGDVAMVKWDRYPETIAMYFGGRGWRDADSAEFDGLEDYLTVRPLVVIDPASDDDLNGILDGLERQGWDTSDGLDSLRAALREFADPTPPIVEPMFLGAVVEDDQGRTWIRYLRPGTSAPWLWSEAPENVARLSVWSAIHAVKVLSDGYDPEAPA